MHRPAQPIYILVLSLLTLLSAFLLFQVQPVISKFILPWFGGSPGVWTTCMLFFQILLFLGYTYAHALGKLPRKVQALLHASLLLAALYFLPIIPLESWKPIGSEDPSGRILLLLLASVGLPYFVLSSTSPLVQVWFTRGAAGANPWRLYALSNIGSLAALLTFPFFFEPRWDVEWLAKAWSVVFVLCAALCLGVVWYDHQTAAPAQEAQSPAIPEDGASPGLLRRLMWVVLPALASVILLATTNHVCQDVAVVPFMWVVPLSLYLLTFIICFEHERWYARIPSLWALPALPLFFVCGTWDQLEKQTWWPDDLDLMPNFLFELGWAFGAMFFGCMICHGELTRLKPNPRYLTSFYLHMSAGGALGGLFVSLAAPQLFKTHAEWPGSLIAAFVLACVVLLVCAWRLRSRALRSVSFALTGLLGASGALFMGQLGYKFEDRLERVRNFYGTLAVTEWSPEDPAYHQRELSNGGIIHGQQNLALQYRSDPTSYYGHDTGIGLALDSLKNANGARVGVVGMGAGTVACYGKSGHTYRFYDINPDVPRLAQKYFTYLPDLEKRGAKLEIVVSDARLALERELSTPQNFDVLLLDAFSGDSVPAHLLTREAFDIYKKHMKPDGIIAVHCTNSYLRLVPLIEKTAAEVGYQTIRITTESDGGDHDSTDYVLLTNNATFLAATTPVPPDEEELELEAKITPRVWTDRHHDLFQILMLELD
ncbi:MAG: fused MFS/spermidine synthase [Verrucomicrobiaceae bacterium]|nr:fused MFS/spermidine synthase [Verrucomicrobiaceae bacterium]